jgi:serine/threonine protein phosphatase PrpC
MIIEKWKNSQTYVIGKYHINNNLPCQDRTFYLEEYGVKVMALADGAGSQPNSQIGAEIVCKEICELLSENFVECLMYFEYEKENPAKHILKMKELNKIILNHVVQKLKEKAIMMNVPLKELSSTLLFFAIKDNHYIYGHIGDGVIVGLYNENNGQRLKVISESENGAAANITFFVTDTDSIDHLRLGSGRIENLAGVVMSSDGAADVLFSKNGIDPSSYELFTKFNMKTSEEYHKILSEFLSKVISNYSTDDMSLNILCLEDNDTDNIEEYYSNYILDEIVSSKQIIRKSQYCYYLDSSIPAEEVEFNNPQEVKRFLKWN